MSTFRITTAMGLALVAISGVAAFSLRDPTVFGAQVAATSALTILLIATLGACLGRARPFWIGFALFGWAYAALSLGPWTSEVVRPQLLSTRCLGVLFAHFVVPNVGYRASVYAQSTTLSGLNALWNEDGGYYHFQTIGHWCLSVLHGLFGGVVGARFAASRRRGIAPEETTR